MKHLFSPFEVKVVSEDDGTFTGYGSTFGNVDSYGDTVAKGAFTKAIADIKSGPVRGLSYFPNTIRRRPSAFGRIWPKGLTA